tara:strand:+ start:111 stop:1199 length:1089 start_codon:yes stop_codon:yes gene_type:complete
MNQINNIKNKILFISNKSDRGSVGGRANLTNLNEKILKNIFKKNFFSINLEKKKIQSLKDILLALTGNIDGITKQKIKIIKDLIKKNDIKYLFIDGSNLGKISRKVRNKNTEIITFCHNVETNFFFKKLKTYYNLKNFYILLVNFLAELQSVYCSDYLIFLNERDKSMMNKYFFKKKSFIIPMCLDDKFKKYKNSINKKNYLVFIGSNFFGNITGLEWYVSKIVNKIDCKTYIIGKNLLRKKFKKNSKIVFKGYVKSLNKFYKNALFTVAPILKGSGMKTKVAESLMHGKYIIGLKEAFTGYEKYEKKIGIKCSNANDFIKAINNFAKKKHYYFNPKLRKIYLDNFSNYSMKNLYQKIFSEI